MNDKFPLPGIIVRWATLILSISGMLVLVARWTAQIDSSLQMVNYKLQQAEVTQQERSIRLDQMLYKVEGMQKLLDDRIAKFDTLAQDMTRRKKALEDMHTSVDALTFRVHELELLMRKMHAAEGK